MSKLSALDIALQAKGAGLNLTYNAQTTTNPNATGEIETRVLSTGDNSITGPAGAVGVVIAPPGNSTLTVLLKNAGGDSGLSISPVNAMVLMFANTPSFILNLSAGATFTLAWI